MPSTSKKTKAAEVAAYVKGYDDAVAGKEARLRSIGSRPRGIDGFYYDGYISGCRDPRSVQAFARKRK